MVTALIVAHSESAARLIGLVADSLTSPESKRAYRKAFGEWLPWYSDAEPRATRVPQSENVNMDQFVFGGFSGFCSDCGAGLPRLREVSAEYFDTGTVQCVGCGRPKELWSAHLHELLERNRNFPGLLSLLAFETHREIELVPGQRMEVDLTTFAPEPAAILAVQYAPSSTCVPVELPVDGRTLRHLPSKVTVAGIEPCGEKRASGPVTIRVTWVPREDYSDGWDFLVDAFESAASKRHFHAIVAAHAAVQVYCGATIAMLRQSVHSGEKQTSVYLKGTFLEPNARSSKKKKAASSPAPPMRKLPKAIFEAWKQLDQIRGSLVHTGEHQGMRPADLSEELTDHLLRAAVFCFEYIRYVRAVLSKGA